MTNYEINFKYRDEYSHGKWNKQKCSLYANNEFDAKRKCIEFYGLNECEYEIISVVKVG